MAEVPRTTPASSSPPDESDRLDSWKEIASYLGREVRTVQGWEKNEGLPIHRHQHARQGSVYAFKTELDAWRQGRKVMPADSPAPDSPPQDAPPAAPIRWRPILVIGILIVFIGGFGLILRRKIIQSKTEASSVVVLPFLDLSPQKDQEYFSDGLTEEIIDALSRVPNLRVVARTSAFSFKGKNADIRQIGQQLNVTNVLEGSVRKDGDQLRITAQLNRVSDGTHLWSHTFDRQLRDIFAVQREISQSIADQLRAGQVPVREGTSDLEAYRLYQEGRYVFNQHNPETSYYKAIEYYQQAVARDPKFGLAFAGLADAYAYLAENFLVAPRDIMPKAKEAAEKAVSLNDNLGEAHISRGIVMMEYEWNVPGAQREFIRAMQINPGSSWARHWYAHSLEAQGRLTEAIKEMHAALDLDPLSVAVHWDIGNEWIWAHNYDEALRTLIKSNELFPNHPLIQYFLAEAYLQKGDFAATHRILQSWPAEMADIPVKISLDGLLAVHEGRRADTYQAIARLERLSKSEYVDPVLVLDLCVQLHDNELLQRWMQRVIEYHSVMFVYLPVMFSGQPEVEAMIAKLH